ncbi:MAG TPA: hypothetical protein VM076_20790 [Gemmatimonadaceae bacterium]|nr:hypothetical protein [Gemmatimonadaceae bacterium]
MRPLERVERTRRTLAAAIAIRAVLWGLCTALVVAALGLVIARRSGSATSVAAWTMAALAGFAVLAWLISPWRRLTVPRVALWIEERVPRLQYALVTAIDPVGGGDVAAPLAAQVAAVTWHDETRAAVMRAVLRPAVAVAAAATALLVARRVDVATATAADTTVSSTTAAARNAPAPFVRLAAVVRTPAYAGGRVVRIESPASVASLVGSTVSLEAPGNGDGISATLGDQPVPVQRAGDAWRVAITIGQRPALVRLRHPSGERIVSLEPKADSIPFVRLMVPLRDTVMRVAQGALALGAETHDDIGLVSGGFEYIVSSGEGESFKFKSGTLGVRQLQGATTGALTASLALDGLELKAGDMVHLRAVARDGNTVSGPGLGASETRVLRVARSGEHDSVAVEGAPPPEADKSLISQRMLIILTEALEKRRPKLARETLVSESRAIGKDQTRLRKRVGDIIFQRLGDDPSGEHGHGPDEQAAADSQPTRADSMARDSVRRAALRAGRSARDVAAADSADSARAALLRAASTATGTGGEILDFEGDETPVVAINRPLLEAYNAMWEASRELDQGETKRALPPMRRALEAIQRARQAERIYLRGKAPAVVVDLARVRLTGKETGTANARVPRPPSDPAAARRAERLANAIELSATSPAAAIDSLVLLRVETLDAAPPLAAALADALDALRAGRDATPLLARARRMAEGGVRSGPLGAWSGSW